MAKFVRKHPDASGTYIAAYREKANGGIEEIKIEGRTVFETDDKKMIEFLRADEAIVEVHGKTKIEQDAE